MAKGGAVLAIVASTMLLAGCAAAPQLPAGPTQAEVKKTVYEQNLRWWLSIAPGEPMPVIEPVRYLDPDEDGHEITDCIVNAQLPGIMGDEDAFFGNISPEAQHQFDRVQFACSMLYPWDMSDPEALGILSPAQLDYLRVYFVERLAPCLELMGYSTGFVPEPDQFAPDGYMQWVPYYSMSPQPQTEREWLLIDSRCPPPPIGEYWRPGLDYAVG